MGRVRDNWQHLIWKRQNHNCTSQGTVSPLDAWLKMGLNLHVCLWSPEWVRAFLGYNEKAAMKNLHQRQKLLFCSRTKCILHIIFARIFVAWFPLFGCFAWILKDDLGRKKKCLLRNRNTKKKPFCLQVHQTLEKYIIHGPLARSTVMSPKEPLC